jgi:hypothetical protein
MLEGRELILDKIHCYRNILGLPYHTTDEINELYEKDTAELLDVLNYLRSDMTQPEVEDCENTYTECWYSNGCGVNDVYDPIIDEEEDCYV